MSKEQAVCNERAEWLSACARRFAIWRARHLHDSVTFEQFREWASSRLDEPHHHNVWGGVAASYVRDGYLRPTGFDQSVRASSHRRVCRVYRVC